MVPAVDRMGVRIWYSTGDYGNLYKRTETHRERKQNSERLLTVVGPDCNVETTTIEIKFRKSTKINLFRLITVFTKTTKPSWNNYQSRKYFFRAKQLQNETPEIQHWNELCDIERDCVFENMPSLGMTVPEFIISITDKSYGTSFCTKRNNSRIGDGSDETRQLR